ncbi:MAG TPA: DUF1365 domain-containing protein [Solirubrobacteraceae bacterium]
MSESCLYRGWVRHRRYDDVAHQLRADLFMAYVDLGELPELFDRYPFASARGRAPVEFRRSDHLGDPARALDEELRDLVAARTGNRPNGPVRLLTNLRYLGLCFNPVSFYYCFEEDGERVAAIVAEVTNTPWGERHAYVLPNDRPGASIMRGRFAKAFHVSPFMGMEHTYAWRLTPPGRTLIAHIDSERDGAVVFDATLSLQRADLTPAALARMVARRPLQTAGILRRIYGNGLRLKLRGARYFPNPTGAPWFGAARRAHARSSREGAAR